MNTGPARDLKVVLDTNVYISTFTHSQGPVFLIWQYAVERRYKLLVSSPIVDELAELLQRDFSWERQEIKEVLKVIVHVGDVVTPRASITALEDSADNRILECAVEGKADLIISGDRDLQRLKVYRDITIVRPMDFLRIFGK